ncbi:MAG: hypothetical protein AAF824_18450 [Bacteroidota bacterium]
MNGATHIWKIYAVGLLLLFGLYVGVMGQNNSRERVQAFKIAYITRTLSLTSAEAEKFWPVYNAYSDEMEALKKENRIRQRSIRGNILSMSDEELEKVLDAHVENKKKEYELFLNYHEEFKQVLPVRKIMLLYRAENDFGKKILEEWRERQKNNRKNNEEK